MWIPSSGPLSLYQNISGLSLSSLTAWSALRQRPHIRVYIPTTSKLHKRSHQANPATVLIPPTDLKLCTLWKQYSNHKQTNKIMLLCKFHIFFAFSGKPGHCTVIHTASDLTYSSPRTIMLPVLDQLGQASVLLQTSEWSATGAVWSAHSKMYSPGWPQIHDNPVSVSFSKLY